MSEGLSERIDSSILKGHEKDQVSDIRCSILFKDKTSAQVEFISLEKNSNFVEIKAACQLRQVDRLLRSGASGFSLFNLDREIFSTCAKSHSFESLCTKSCANGIYEISLRFLKFSDSA
tara:strand:+ start:702 stop:1058 length:357 start_codon:yes stop_codon:yes gene_type:complete